jgi:DNA-binding PadR family transcriptional regulator
MHSIYYYNHHMSIPTPDTPLSHLGFYVLLALSRGELHGYALGGRVWNESQRTISAPAGTLYPLLKRMRTDGLIEAAGMWKTGSQQKERLHYRITPEGLTRLKIDLQRMKHAVDIGERAGHFNDTLPPDLQRLLESLK